MSLSTIALWVLVLYAVQIFLQETACYRFNLWRIMGNRDDPPHKSAIAGRLERAKDNLLEALPFFITLTALDLIMLDDLSAASDGALIFLAARIAYVPAYVSGIPVLRSLIWLVANAGLVVMALPLLGLQGA